MLPSLASLATPVHVAISVIDSKTGREITLPKSKPFLVAQRFVELCNKNSSNLTFAARPLKTGEALPVDGSKIPSFDRKRGQKALSESEWIRDRIVEVKQLLQKKDLSTSIYIEEKSLPPSRIHEEEKKKRRSFLSFL